MIRTLERRGEWRLDELDYRHEGVPLFWIVANGEPFGLVQEWLPFHRFDSARAHFDAVAPKESEDG